MTEQSKKRKTPEDKWLVDLDRIRTEIHDTKINDATKLHIIVKNAEHLVRAAKRRHARESLHGDNRKVFDRFENCGWPLSSLIDWSSLNFDCKEGTEIYNVVDVDLVTGVKLTIGAGSGRGGVTALVNGVPIIDVPEITDTSPALQVRPMIAEPKVDVRWCGTTTAAEVRDCLWDMIVMLRGWEPDDEDSSEEEEE